MKKIGKIKFEVISTHPDGSAELEERFTAEAFKDKEGKLRLRLPKIEPKSSLIARVKNWFKSWF